MLITNLFLKELFSISMELISCSNYEELSVLSSSYILSFDNLVLGLASGNSPKKVYQYLVKNISNKQKSIISGFQIDEYVSCPPSDSSSFNYYINENVIIPLNTTKIITIDGLKDNTLEACKNYLNKIKTLSYANIMILGLGTNGHIAFNEPGSKLNSTVRLVKLQHKAKFNMGFTVGIKEILKSKELILLVTGLNKKEIFEKFLNEKESALIPATYLKRHKKLKIYLDEEIYLT